MLTPKNEMGARRPRLLSPRSGRRRAGLCLRASAHASARWRGEARRSPESCCSCGIRSLARLAREVLARRSDAPVLGLRHERAGRVIHGPIDVPREEGEHPRDARLLERLVERLEDAHRRVERVLQALEHHRRDEHGADAPLELDAVLPAGLKYLVHDGTHVLQPVDIVHGALARTRVAERLVNILDAQRIGFLPLGVLPRALDGVEDVVDFLAELDLTLLGQRARELDGAVDHAVGIHLGHACQQIQQREAVLRRQLDSHAGVEQHDLGQPARPAVLHHDVARVQVGVHVVVHEHHLEQARQPQARQRGINGVAGHCHVLLDGHRVLEGLHQHCG
mmetsp:Transcript_4046/g.16200  ORF Transcript_4046/g.16200 Transcript_4046/m.16200 type:complete len:336 (-) Transcript_4046:860-1867(-)